MKRPFLLLAMALSACAPRVITRTETVEVPVIHVERSATPDDVLGLQPPAPLPPRPATARAAASILAAKLCEYVRFAGKVDLIAQHAAGLTPKSRVVEALCVDDAVH